jgi:hypothetical protein
MILAAVAIVIVLWATCAVVVGAGGKESTVFKWAGGLVLFCFIAVYMQGLNAFASALYRLF